MVLFDWLNEIDTQLLMLINGNNNSYFDVFFSLFTNKLTWLPLYGIIAILIFHKYKTNGIWILISILIAITFSDQISGLLKDTIQRLRPGHNSTISELLNLPIGKRGMYSFVSSHAANSFALAIIIGLLAKSKRVWLSMLIWALLTSYSRVYVGVHYPFDVICGGILGAAFGYGSYKLLHFFDNRFQRKKIHYSGYWKPKYSTPLLLTLTIITVTLLIVSRLILKINL